MKRSTALIQQMYYFVSGLVVTMIALVLPHRARVAFGYSLNYFFKPFQAIHLLGRSIIKICNFLILVIMYVVGFGSSKVLYMIMGPHMVEKTVQTSYWHPREPIEMVLQGMVDPF